VKQIRLSFSYFRPRLLPAFLAWIIDYWQIVLQLFILKTEGLSSLWAFQGRLQYAFGMFWLMVVSM